MQVEENLSVSISVKLTFTETSKIESRIHLRTIAFCIENVLTVWRICGALLTRPMRATAWLDRLHSRRSSFSLRIQSHSISRAWLTFNRRRDSRRCRSSLFSPRAFRRSRLNSNVLFDCVARTRDVTCASNICPPLFLSIFFLFLFSLISLLPQKTIFPRFPPPPLPLPLPF